MAHSQTFHTIFFYDLEDITYGPTNGQSEEYLRNKMEEISGRRIKRLEFEKQNYVTLCYYVVKKNFRGRYSKNNIQIYVSMWLKKHMWPI